MPTISLKVLPHGEDLPLPSYATAGAAGMDLYAACHDFVEIPWGARVLFPTGIAVAIPPGFEWQIRSRSGLALKHGVVVANSPGTVDSDYRGEVGVILHNAGPLPFIVRRGDRIAQAVLAPVARVDGFAHVAEMPPTDRGAGGFGSTGTR